MKNLIFFLMVTAAVLSVAWSYGNSSKDGAFAVGTITVCYNTEDCAPPSGTTTKIVLIDVSNGGRIDSCVIPAGRSCCNMTGDYSTSTYRIEYSQPGSGSPCSTANFSYTNGTSPTLNVICPCP